MFFLYWVWDILQAIISIAKDIWVYMADRGKQRLRKLHCTEGKGLSHICEAWYLAFQMHLACGLHQLQSEIAKFHLTNLM